jgi:hypothetical protein
MVFGHSIAKGGPDATLEFAFFLKPRPRRELAFRNFSSFVRLLAPDLFVRARLVAATGNEPGNKIRRAPCGLTQQRAETKKYFAVHAFNGRKLSRAEFCVLPP